MDWKKWRVFNIKLVVWRMFYGIIMYFSFIILSFRIYDLIMDTKNRSTHILPIITGICIIIFSYLIIMYWINPWINKYGEKTPLITVILEELENEKRKKEQN